MRQEGGTEAPAERAQILVVMAMLVPVLLIFVGVAIDGSRLFEARLDAQILADRAADAGAQQVDITGSAVVRAGGPAELVQGRGRGSAYAAADDVFASRGAPSTGRIRWSIGVEPRVITVTVERDVELIFMPIAGLRTQTVVARSVSGPLNGIGAPVT